MTEYQIKDVILDHLSENRTFFTSNDLKAIIELDIDEYIIRAYLQEMEAFDHVFESTTPGFYKITPAGEKFRHESSYSTEHFQEQLYNAQIVNENRRDRLKDDWKFWLSVFAIIIAMISLLLDIIK